MFRIACLISAVLVGAVTLGTSAHAYELHPISREFAPSGSGATQSYEVISKEKSPIAISVSVVSRSLDTEGTETNELSEDDFFVYPPQFILPAGARQTLRVTWLGDPQPAQELAYRLVV